MAGLLRIASVPAAHPYVAHLGDAGVVRLPDPSPAGAPAGRWWPPAMVDPAWIRAHAGTFDLLHLHFGTESFTAAHLADVVAALRRAQRPLVYTVHDLENPQLADQAAHVAQLDVLIPAADALVTLTPGAAAQVARRWGRAAEVVAHPHVLPLDAVAPVGPRRAGQVVGLHLRDLRPNVDGAGATATLLAAIAALRATGADVTARVELHARVRDDGAREAVRRLCGRAPFATLVEAPRPSDAALVAGLAALDVSVLPYAHGTHSGWVELCWDLGVAVAAPGVGCWAEQHPDPAFLRSFAPGSATGLVSALGALLSAGPPGTAGPGTPARRALQRARRAERRAQRGRIAAAHLALYRSVVRGAGASSGPAR